MRQIAAIGFINVVLIAGVAIAANNLVINTRDLRFDFYPHYVGGRAVWRGVNPYTHEITQAIQMGMFGEFLPPQADQQNMAYPAYSSVLLGPIVILSAKVAIAVWMAIQFVAILWTPIIWLTILNWRPAPLLIGLILFGLLFVFRFPMDTFVLGQFSGTVLLAVSLGFLLLLQGKDWWAGVVLSLAMVPPTIGGPLALSILVAFGLRGRWRGLMSFLAMIVALTLISFILIGNWIPDYINIVNAYQNYAEVAWAPDVLGGPVLRGVFIGGLVLFSGWLLWRYWQSESEHEARERGIDLALTAMIVCLLLIPQTGEYYLVLLIPPILACIQRAEGQGLVYISCIVLVLSPWLYPRGSLPTLFVPLHGLMTWVLVNRKRWQLAF